METTIDFILKYSDGSYVPKSKKCAGDLRLNHYNARSFHTSKAAFAMSKYYRTTQVIKRVSTLTEVKDND